MANETLERERLQEELRKSEEITRALLNAPMDRVLLLDPDGRILAINETSARSFGRSVEELVGLNAFDLFSPEVASRRRACHEEAVRTGKPLRYEDTREGRWLDTGLHPICDGRGRVIRVAVFSRDITEYKRNQEELEQNRLALEDRIAARTAELQATNEALRESEERFRALAEYSPFGLSIMRPNLTFEYFNPKFQELFGYSLEDVPDKERWFELAYPDLQYRETVIRTWREDSDRIIDAGHMSTRMFSVRCKDGQDKVILFRNVALQDGRQLMTYEDVTARTRAEKALQESEKRYRKLYEESRRAEAQLLQAHKMEAIGTLAGGVAHDFNNILQAISGYTQLLMFGKAPGDPDLQHLEAIFQSAGRAGELTRRLLIFGRKVESRLRPVNLNHEMEQVVKILKWTIPRMIRIDMEAAPDLRIIDADPVQLEQIMMNLAVNARDVMPEGGRLVFRTTNIHLDEPFCRRHMGASPGEYVLLSVSDTGHGMTDAVRQHIFEPFFTTKGIGHGTGLGLAMVYGIVKSHGGYIACDSGVDQGTTFRIYFPVLRGESSPVHPGTGAGEEVPGGTETILLVDDEPTILDIARNFLEHGGYTVAAAENGEQALERIRRERPQLVILDLSMPGMGGYRCLEAIRKADPGIKVIVASGYSSPDEVRKAMAAGASGFLEKPYVLAGMLQKVRDVLDGRP